MNDNEKYIEDFVKDIPFDTPDAKHRDSLKKQLLSAYPKHRLQPMVRTFRLWKVIMHKPIIKLAAAAAIIIAVWIVFWGNDSDRVAWGQVLDNINRVKAFAYHAKLNIKGIPQEKDSVELELDGWFSKEYGARINSYEGGTLRTKEYVLISDRKYVALIPEAKKYLRMTLTEELFEKRRKGHGDPRKLVEEFMKYDYDLLGRTTIDGIVVEGIECRDPKIAQGIATVAGEMISNVVARLWADVENDLPVKLQIEVFTEEGSKVIDLVTHGYQWDIEVDTEMFIPDIPDDYELAADIELSTDEKSILEGLSFFAEYADGRYPSEMSAMSISRELRAALIARFGGQVPWPPKPEDSESAMNLEMAIRFYANLVMEKKEPAFYGDKVTAEFPHAVLMRWKMDDGRYKVIFADLTVEEVTAEELVELESAPLNIEPKAIKPHPADGSGGTVLSGLKISWIPGANVTEHKVYFGTNPNSLPLLGEVTTDYAELPKLERNTTYHWRIDEIQPDGSVVAGDLWNFNTGRLVAWWKFDDGSGSTAIDSSGNGLDCTLVGETSWVDGIAAGALAFDGDGDYVDAGKGPDFDIKNQITIMAWIKVGAFDRDWQAIITKGDRGWRLQRNQGTNTLEFACSGLNVPDTQWGQVYGTVDVNDDHWHHVAGTYDGSKICLYVDGQLDASSTASGTIRVNDQPVYIGANSEMPDRFWNGIIDDVRIYNYALNTEEIAAITQNQAILLFK